MRKVRSFDAVFDTVASYYVYVKCLMLCVRMAYIFTPVKDTVNDMP